MIEYHDTQTLKERPAYYLARLVSPDYFLNDFWPPTVRGGVPGPALLRRSRPRRTG
ncbi:hypothetical protein OIA45_46325 (plasmid) [Streptomyces chartreusis]|uniref:hypothetical protein n=1 Tax=Streptomyces chartreusis TaxID=1969 RepID=UPI002F90C38A|nr:hypothetical protein OIA45_46325 [Streptomyces chartreusis]